MPTLLKLGASLVYEALTIIAISFACAGLFVWIVGDATHGVQRLLLQFFLWLAVGLYFTRCWVKSGQTLAMQAWRLKLVRQNNQLLPFPIALIRYLLASISLAICGFGFLWALLDRDRLFLHDRLLKSRIVVLAKPG